MPLHLALLRGINVGKKTIKMEDLRKLMESSGYKNVKTYIQSGNVFFDNPEKNKAKLAVALEGLIEKQYGFDVTVFIIDINDIANAVDNNPLAKRDFIEEGTKKLYVTFLSDKPLEENMEKLRQAPIGEDIVELVDNVLYFKLESKASESKLTNNLIESKLKVKATTRNWNVTVKLLSMFEEM